MYVAYKYVPKKYAGSFEDGSQLLFGTLSYYRKMEGDRADGLEGWGVNLVSSLQNANSENQPDIFHRLEKLGQNFQNVKTLNMKNVMFLSQHQETLLFCASKDRDMSRVEKGDIEFRIDHFEVFCSLIAYHEHWSILYPAIHQITYEDRISDLSISDPIFANPFAKPKDFSWENEVRAAWPVLPNMNFDADGKIVVNCPEVSPFITRLS